MATGGSGIWEELARRVEERPVTKVVKGTKEAILEQLARWADESPIIQWRISAVQPGVADAQLEGWTQGNALMLAAHDTCRAQGVTFRLVDART